jgi:heme-degrading monooxygenase HmoA
MSTQCTYRPGLSTEAAQEISMPGGRGIGTVGGVETSGEPFAELVDREGGYVAVIFTSQGTGKGEEYGKTAEAMQALAAEQPGYLGIESVTGADGFGITVSYWATEADGRAWKRVAEHAEAQRRGRDEWYSRYAVRVARVERQYGWSAD